VIWKKPRLPLCDAKVLLFDGLDVEVMRRLRGRLGGKDKRSSGGGALKWGGIYLCEWGLGEICAKSFCLLNRKVMNGKQGD
jgi:hypothetical protein